MLPPIRNFDFLSIWLTYEFTKNILCLFGNHCLWKTNNQIFSLINLLISSSFIRFNRQFVTIFDWNKFGFRRREIFAELNANCNRKSRLVMERPYRVPRVVGVPVGKCSGGWLATMLVGTISDCIFLHLLFS